MYNGGSGSACCFNASSSPSLLFRQPSSNSSVSVLGLASYAPLVSGQHSSCPTVSGFGVSGQQSSTVSAFGGVPSTSLFGQQSSSVPPFEVGAAPSTSFTFTPSAPSYAVHSKPSSFGHLGSSVASVGVTSTSSLFGQQSSSAPLLGGASSTPSTFGSSLPPFLGSSTTPVFAQQNSTYPSSYGFGGNVIPAMTGNSNEGTRLAPYGSTCLAEHETGTLISISAMNAYHNKCHEELRSEDYKQQRIGGPNPPTGSLGVSKHWPNPFQSNSSSFTFRPTALAPTLSSEHVNKSTSPFQTSGSNIQSQNCAPFNFAPIHSMENVPESSGWYPPQASVTQTNAAPGSTAPQTSNANKTSNVNVNPAAPQTSIANETSNVNVNPATPQTSVANETSNVNANGQTSSSEALFGASFIPAFVNCLIPAFGALGLNGRSSGAQTLTSELGTTIFVPTAVALIPQHPLVSAPAAAPPMPPSDIQSIPRMIPVTGWPFTGVLGGQSSNSSTFAPAPPTSVAPSASTFPYTTSSGSWFTVDGAKCSPQYSTVGRVDPSLGSSTSIPKGLELIVQTLGANPWADNDHLDDFQVRKILPCDDASYDADIVSLAEFAVEQHNAMDKDNKVKLLKVNAACLEAVDGGRYHIVLEASKGPSLATRVYAAVLRKKTDRPTHLTVLERWLPGLVFGLL
ncbi:hypothetical protein vseg_003244 [Gypsophila vaccaria]